MRNPGSIPIPGSCKKQNKRKKIVVCINNMPYIQRTVKKSYRKTRSRDACLYHPVWNLNSTLRPPGLRDPNLWIQQSSLCLRTPNPSPPPLSSGMWSRIRNCKSHYEWWHSEKKFETGKSSLDLRMVYRWLFKRVFISPTYKNWQGHHNT